MQLGILPADADTAVTGEEFAAHLLKFGPFEASPRLAVACSGGADSIALLGLVCEWAKHREGEVVAMVVDHRLRPESTGEAADVVETASRLGIDARILTRTGGPVHSNVQQHAREVRYRLLSHCCRELGIPHLFLAHHMDDQAETVQMRAARSSGVDGLAGMAPLLELGDVRILRPLLNISKRRLRATASAMGLPILEDPSNDDARFERVRVRRDLAETKCAGDIVATAIRYGHERRQEELLAASHLAMCCAIFPEGYAVFDTEALIKDRAEIVCRCLAAACAMIGGRSHPPRRARTRRLYDAIVTDGLAGGRTMAGCRIVPNGRRLFIYREAASIAESVPVTARNRWDGRFVVEVNQPSEGLQVAKLGQDGVRELREDNAFVLSAQVPRAVLPTLPAIRGVEGIRYVPHLCYSKNGDAFDGKIRFAPIRPLQAARFTL